MLDIGKRVKYNPPYKWGVSIVGTIVQWTDVHHLNAIVGYPDCMGIIQYITLKSCHLSLI